MLSERIKLFSWVDAEDFLLEIRNTKGFPEWLKSVHAYWDALTITIDPGKKAETVKWLADTFEPRFRQSSPDMEDIDIILEGMEDFPRHLQVVIIESDDALSESRFLPSLSRPEILKPDIPKAKPDDFEKDRPQLMALHSFKGGVGRTLLALTIAKVIAEKKNNRVLLIDADLEAPGITWLLEDRLSNPTISFADVLTLLHGASDSREQIEKTLRLIADRVQSSYLDGIYVLPAFRSREKFVSLQIKPEHLIRYADNQYIITDSISELGKMLGVSAVIADLRAGLSELSTGFLLDPRVHRIFVTTFSPQSVEGTEYVLQLIKERVTRKPNHPVPKVNFSQRPITRDLNEKDLAISIEKIEKAGEDLGIKRQDMLFTIQEERLTIPEPVWDEMMKSLDNTDLKRTVEEIWFSETISPVDVSNIQKLRKQLLEETTLLMNTESGNVKEFFQFRPILNLANDFRKQLPIIVVEGDEGSGKTCAFLQIVQKQGWKNFIATMGKDESSPINALCYPVFYSKTLDREVKQQFSDKEKQIREYIGFSEALTSEKLTDKLFEYIEEKPEEEQWRKFWLNQISRRMGFGLEEEDAGQRFPNYLREHKKNVIAVIDGLEDIVNKFRENESEESRKRKPDDLNAQKLAEESKKMFYSSLKVLLQDIPAWLNQQPDRPLGLIIFVRSHVIKDIFQQYSVNFSASYAPYRLKWGIKDALQFCLWMYEKISSPQNINMTDILSLSEYQLTSRLTPLWGTEFRLDLVFDSGQIRIRDVVRFLHSAAKHSLKDMNWKDSLLSRDAISKSEKEYFMELTGKQQTRLRQISDDRLFNDAVRFIEKSGTITNSQISGLDNIADTASGFSEIYNFVGHQAKKDNKSSKFYTALKTELDSLWKSIQDDRDFIPENLTKKQSTEHKEFFGLLFAREFIHHLSAENIYRSEE